MLHTHMRFLIDLANALDAKGFSHIHIDDPDLERRTFDEHGAKGMAEETLAVDDGVVWNATWLATGETLRLFLFTCNSPWETVADHTVLRAEAGDAAEAAIQATISKYE